ncbi:MAG: tRNA epoxyqueuosine(34) reductase QueG [Gammaproteobacteria bacterium]|nr:tRNA epoxyqueuosine(34) reductase QueG [Gammaproteobacteria bacterium]
MTGESNKAHSSVNRQALVDKIKTWARELGFDAAGITDVDLTDHEKHLDTWIKKGMHGQMDYMHKHGTKRTRPNELVEGTVRVISVRMDYSQENIKQAEKILKDSEIAYISRYALGRDYHKVIRTKLKHLAKRIEAEIGPFGYRVFTDSAPVLEKALAEKSGLGWIGKHSNLLNSKTGSWFFLGEIYVDIDLPIDSPASNHCGTCRNCIDLCPTQAIVGPYQVDARKCISYLTIELRESIPEKYRKQIGNRIYGCDDCQLVCPWNKFAQATNEKDFTPRAQLTDKKLVDLLDWSEMDFLKHTEGSAIRRIGYQAWVRNIAIGLGNAKSSNTVISAIKRKLLEDNLSEMAIEHLNWAIDQHA